MSIVKDFKTRGYVLRRTNYGEADRILNIITPEGKITAIAKGVRKEKSKLAGGVEIFSLSELNMHRGRSEFAIVTGARMIKFYGNILRNYEALELASVVLRRISAVADGLNSAVHFDIVEQVLEALDRGVSVDVVRVWFCFNLITASGEEINLYRDDKGDKLNATKRYIWDNNEKCLVEMRNGDISQNEIKAMRLILAERLELVSRIKNIDETIPSILRVAEGFSGFPSA